MEIYESNCVPENIRKREMLFIPLQLTDIHVVARVRIHELAPDNAARERELLGEFINEIQGRSTNYATISEIAEATIMKLHGLASQVMTTPYDVLLNLFIDTMNEKYDNFVPETSTLEEQRAFLKKMEEMIDND